MKLYNLKLVDSYPFYRKELDLSADEGDSHSLHSAVRYPESSNTQAISYLISSYSNPGDVILDPFAGSGTVALETGLLGRVPFASDVNPLSAILADAKLQPADLTEVTLKLQLVNLRRPLDLDHYNEYFSPFYEVNTFRELLNLRQFLGREPERICNHIKLLALSLLHGTSGSFFSAGSPAHVALSPKEQADYNQSRRQEPDYRAVIPRIIKRSATILRDGIPSVLLRSAAKRKIFTADARDLNVIRTSQIDLILTVPPIPGSPEAASLMWLENWFAGYSTQEIKQKMFIPGDRDEWLGFMNECLLEWARVVGPAGRVALVLPEPESEALLAMVDSDLARFWEPDSLIVAKSKTNVIKKSASDKRNHYVVLRRK